MDRVSTCMTRHVASQSLIMCLCKCASVPASGVNRFYFQDVQRSSLSCVARRALLVEHDLMPHATSVSARSNSPVDVSALVLVILSQFGSLIMSGYREDHDTPRCGRLTSRCGPKSGLANRRDA